MQPVRITYDPDGDILSITFGQPTGATGYQLSDQLLLRVDPQAQRAAGLTIFHFSVHAHTTHEIPSVTHFLRVVEGKQGVSAIVLNPSLQEAVTG